MPSLSVDWNNKDAVVAYAKELAKDMAGKGLTVYKNKTRPNYNIMHTQNEPTLLDKTSCTVVHRTGG